MLSIFIYIQIKKLPIYGYKLCPVNTFIKEILYFSEEIHDLNYTGQIKKRSNIRSLAPFVDSNGIIKVGGRLTQAKIHYDQKHPILLPEKDYITELILSLIHIYVISPLC